MRKNRVSLLNNAFSILFDLFLNEHFLKDGSINYVAKCHIYTCNLIIEQLRSTECAFPHITCTYTIIYIFISLYKMNSLVLLPSGNIKCCYSIFYISLNMGQILTKRIKIVF